MPIPSIEGRLNHTATWTGSEMVVWGGQGTASESLGDGARFDPSVGEWSRMSGVGAPPIALLYQHRKGPELRPTLAFVYTASSAIILVFLTAVGQFGAHETGLALWLVPGYVVGYLLATPLAGILDRGYSRVAVLALSTVSAVILLFRSL